MPSPPPTTPRQLLVQQALTRLMGCRLHCRHTADHIHCTHTAHRQANCRCTADALWVHCRCTACAGAHATDGGTLRRPRPA
jgi:hypothetical protein